ncbi:hypothetical protein DL766_000173 [Monosporascus sp. MC13-8B]|uniref:SRR1-like domain-containing protein n=1 Tax=Monosporascus cannonballus TaxID=155416 RepID=A0ABY0HJX0_9PEZI|nr:hypothetical protein DL762_001621 [Monosporascus cannonballus]RYP01539.1 hypothetical protein DL763_000070 [Monosporascus cannonballus]RYP39964.1 hypothetical protein DL766_000173 [Monosporascus sp. MC13-8B]
MTVPYPSRDNSIFRFDPGTIRQDAEGDAHHLASKNSIRDAVDVAAAGGAARGEAAPRLPDSERHDAAARRRPLACGTETRQWDRVGTDVEGRNENPALRLAEYLSYDEMMLGSLLGVSGPSHFVNDGDRCNRAVEAAPGTYEPRGVVVGLVGARFERPGRMDSVHCLPSSRGTAQHPQLTALFQNFFTGSAHPRDQPAAFDAAMYKARMRATVDVLLLEANDRALAAGRKAYVYVVGFGLGVWKVDNAQPRLYVEAFAEALGDLGTSGGLGSLGTLEFAWIDLPATTQRQVTDAAARLGVRVKFSRRNPAAKLAGEETDQLLVLSYAWDSNAFPGNEYWLGSLAASGDPAAACMSTISELHNPVMNPGFLERIKVLQPSNR